MTNDEFEGSLFFADRSMYIRRTPVLTKETVEAKEQQIEEASQGEQE